MPTKETFVRAQDLVITVIPVTILDGDFEGRFR